MMMTDENYLDAFNRIVFYGEYVCGPIAATLFLLRFVVPMQFTRTKRMMLFAEILFATVVYITIFFEARAIP